MRNVCADASLAEIEDAAEAAQLLPFIESLPDKWDTVVSYYALFTTLSSLMLACWIGW